MDITQRAKKIKLLLLDVDGVLTDGRIILGSYGDELKNFDVNDGLGIVLLKRSGLRCAIITAKSSKAVKIRMKQLGIDRIYEDHFKINAFARIIRRYRVQEEEVCFIGDDVIDAPVLKRVGFAVAVPNAVGEVKALAHYVTENRGGRGAVREVCELILKAQDKWEEITGKYFG